MVEYNSMVEGQCGGKPDYTEYVAYMEGLGWRRSQVTLNQNYAKIVTVAGGALATTANIIDIRVPAGQKMSIMGTQQISRGADARTAHALRVRFAGTSDAEISLLSTVRMTKEKTIDDVVQLHRGFYADISYNKQLLSAQGATPSLKTDLEWYRFKQGIEFNGEEHFIISTIAETPTGGPNLPDVVIESTHVKFALDCDFFSS